MKKACLFLLALWPTLAWAAPPTVPETMDVRPGQMVRVTVKTDKKVGTLKNFTDSEAFWGELVAPAGAREFVFQAPLPEVDPKTGKLLPLKRTSFVVGWWTEGELTGVSTTITVKSGVAPIPPTPTPIPPCPPDPPVPVPVTEFQVLMVYESSDTKTPAQIAVMEGKAVEDWMTANCSNGKTGWGRVDKDFPPERMPVLLLPLWRDVKPKITKWPCCVVAVNKEATIIDLEPTPTAMINVLTKYKEGK